MSVDPADLLPIAHRAADLARELVRTLQPGTLTGKGDRDMASEVDYAVERAVRALLAAQTPDIGFLGEEEGGSGDPAGLRWCLDPVDGTVNFVHGSPLCAVSLGLIDGDRSVLGIIDLPFLGTRYAAADGHGAYADGERIRTSTVSRLDEALVALGDYAVGADAAEQNTDRLAVTRELARRALRIRMHGSAAIDLAWLAHGRVDAQVMLTNKPWDTSAGVVIAREAGVLLVDVDGGPHTFHSTATIGANPALLPALLDLVQRAAGKHCAD